MKKSVLLIGGGGREHALAWKIRQSPGVGKIYCVPGNPGIATVAECIDHGIKTADDFNWLADFAAEQNIALTVVGPEAPLIGNHVGIVDIFKSRSRNLRIFGPTRAGALIEGDKTFCMRLCKKYNIPTPDFGIFDDASAAKSFVRSLGFPVVVKNNWPRAGKGVTIADTTKLADFAIDEIIFDPKSGGPPVVIQEFIHGRECSVIGITDGKDVFALAPARDYKRVSKTDSRMTGGLGAYSPVGDVNDTLLNEIIRTILQRTVRALAQERIIYRGALYAGLMLTDKGPKVLEFNCRFGDPETQAILPRFDGDLFELLMAATSGTLASYKNYRWLPDTCICRVMASEGYPGDNLSTGYKITGIEKANAIDRVVVFQAGTAMKHGRLVNIGGRVLGVTALGDDWNDAMERVIKARKEIHFDGAWWREINKEGSQ